MIIKWVEADGRKVKLNNILVYIIAFIKEGNWGTLTYLLTHLQHTYTHDMTRNGKEWKE
jgi:hypothetical protein